VGSNKRVGEWGDMLDCYQVHGYNQEGSAAMVLVCDIGNVE